MILLIRETGNIKSSPIRIDPDKDDLSGFLSHQDIRDFQRECAVRIAELNSAYDMAVNMAMIPLRAKVSTAPIIIPRPIIVI